MSEDDDMKDNYDFSDAKRGPILKKNGDTVKPSELCEKCGQDLFNPTALEAAIKRGDKIQEQFDIAVNNAMPDLMAELTEALAELEHMTEKFERNSIAAGDYSLQLDEARATIEKMMDGKNRMVTAFEKNHAELTAANARVKVLEIQIEHFHENKGWIVQSALEAEKAKSARLVEALKSFPMSHSRTCDSDKCYEYCPSELKRKALAAYAEPQDEGDSQVLDSRNLTKEGT